MRFLTFVLFFLFTRVAAAQGAIVSVDVPLTTSSQQLLLVRAASWQSSTGSLERFAKTSDGQWQRVGEAADVNLGRSGLAWGRGLHAIPAIGPRKREGDGKSPAGAFALGHAFGVAAGLPQGALQFPYVQTSPGTYCVEDTRSEFYNRIVDAADVVAKGWQKWSELLRTDGLFDWGIVVEQNAEHPTKGAGSCVFLHLWRGPRRPTAGCTAMERAALETILRWLDSASHPLLVQLPEATYQSVRQRWGLP